nr:hypothetical protein [Bacilli bacterium]
MTESPLTFETLFRTVSILAQRIADHKLEEHGLNGQLQRSTDLTCNLSFLFAYDPWHVGQRSLQCRERLLSWSSSPRIDAWQSYHHQHHFV